MCLLCIEIDAFHLLYTYNNAIIIIYKIAILEIYRNYEYRNHAHVPDIDIR